LPKPALGSITLRRVQLGDSNTAGVVTDLLRLREPCFSPVYISMLLNPLGSGLVLVQSWSDSNWEKPPNCFVYQCPTEAQLAVLTPEQKLKRLHEVEESKNPELRLSGLALPVARVWRGLPDGEMLIQADESTLAQATLEPGFGQHMYREHCCGLRVETLVVC
jgi:hypothetical protein